MVHVVSYVWAKCHISSSHIKVTLLKEKENQKIEYNQNKFLYILIYLWKGRVINLRLCVYINAYV